MRFALMVSAALGLAAMNLGCDAFGYQDGAGANARGTFVLAHGLGANAELGFSNDIAAALVDDGYAVYKTEVPAFDSIENRALALADQVDGILEITGTEKIHIIGHSMGGLDSRFLISSLGYADKIESLTTIATPHRGSPVADYVLEDDGDGALFDTLQSVLAPITGDTEADKEATRRAVIDLTETQAIIFNQQNPDAPSVRYLSWSGFATAAGFANEGGTTSCRASESPPPEPHSLGLTFLPIALIVSKDGEVGHDGLVPVESARWGEFRGCVAADHFDEVGVPVVADGFDYVEFFRRVASDVAP